MERTYIKNLNTHVGERVSISGWVDVRRDHGKLVFIDVRDATGIVQVVMRPESAGAYEAGKTLRGEWVARVDGVVNARPDNMVNSESETGGIEVVAESIAVLAEADELPFGRDEHLNIDTYLDHLPLTLRTDRARAIFTTQAAIIETFRSFLRERGFTEIQSPKLIGADAEGGASVFDVPYFGRTAHLAQSPQFYKQIMVGVYERVFATGNAYRAEKHSTTRHLNEYTSLDLEIGFIDDHRDVMRVSGELVAHIVNSIESEYGTALSHFGVPPVSVVLPIPSLKLREAQEIIFKEHGDDCRTEPDLSPQHERWLSEYALKTFSSDFVFITHYPAEKRPMYTYEDPDDPGYTKSFDLLFRGLEIQTGGQRIHEHDTLVANMKKKGLDPKQFSFYLQAFKYGMPPHGGFGMGLERLTARLLGIDNVKEATLFPRDMNRIDTLLSD